MQKSELKDVPLHKIIPYKKNPRLNEKAILKVAESIKYHGYLKTSIGIDENFVLLYGHTTLKALERLEILVVPEVSQITGLTEAQKISYRIADNKTSEYAKWDFDLLYENMKMLEKAEGFKSLDSMGMSTAEIAALRKSHESSHDLPTPNAIKTNIKEGDLILLGKHRLVCGDCTNPELVEKLYGEDLASICFTSPPYNLGKEGWLPNGTSKYEGNDDDSDVVKYLTLLTDATNIHLDKSVYLFLNIQMVKGNKLALLEYLNLFRFNLADIIIWDKQSAQPAMQENVLNSQFEFILCLKDEPANRKIGTQKFRGTVSNVYSAPPNRENQYADIHSATFPMHLPSFIIKSFSNPKDIISDPFAGTGTTLLACEQLARTCFAMELNPLFCEITCLRWEALTGKTRLFPHKHQ
jgi:DNA modification methylase